MKNKLVQVFNSFDDEMNNEIAELNLTFNAEPSAVKAISSHALSKVGLCKTEKEIINMTDINKGTAEKYGHKKCITVVLVAAVITSILAISAIAYSGGLRNIIVSGKPETAKQAEDAMSALNDFVGGEIGLENSEYAVQSNFGSTLFYFENYEETVENKLALVKTDDKTGCIYWLDLRMAFPYSVPKDCPAEYISNTQDLDGNQQTVFYADEYLTQVKYSDRDSYALIVEDAVYDIMKELKENGFINVDLSTIETTYFEMFNGGSANVAVLMKNGDAYRVFMHPDSLECLGFMLLTKQELEANNGPGALYDALRNGTVEEYTAAQQESFSNGVG